MHQFAFKFGLTLSILTLTSLASAQDAQRLPGVVDKNLPKVDIKSKKSAKKNLTEQPAKPKKSSGRVLTTLKDVVFSGDSSIAITELENIAAPYIGKKVTNSDIAQIKYEVTKAFYEKGAILTKIVTPKQNISSGILKIDIYEAEVGAVRTSEQNVIPDWVVDGYTRDAEGKRFNERDAETLISNIDDLKGLRATLSLQPGEKFKTTDLNVQIREEKEANNYVYIDNYGSELTGEGVFTAHLEGSNLLGIGELLYTDIRRSNEDLWSAQVGAELPTGFKSTTLELDYLHSENDIGARLVNLNASGETDKFHIALSRKFINTQEKTATLRTGFEARNHRSFIAGATETKDNIRQAYVEGTWLQRFSNGIVYGAAKVAKGLDVFGGREEGVGFGPGLLATVDQGATNALGDPEAWIFQPILFTSFSPWVDGQFKTLFTGQLASESLLSSDLFSIGGVGSVRGFEPAQQSGDRGFQFSIEYNHLIDVHPDFEFKAGPFLDGAKVFSNQTNFSFQDELYSVGIGAETTASLIPYGDTILRVDVAFPVGGYADSNIADNSIYFRLKQEF